MSRGTRWPASAQEDWQGDPLALESFSAVAWTIPLLSGSPLIGLSVSWDEVPQS
jgi:hypothetical protein